VSPGQPGRRVTSEGVRLFFFGHLRLLLGLAGFFAGIKHPESRRGADHAKERGVGVMADNVALVEQAYEAFGRGDVETVLGLFSEDIKWFEAENSPSWPGRAFRGPQEIVEGVFARLGAETQDFRITVSRTLGCGETVLVQGRYSGWWAASGTSFDLQMAHIWDFEDGKVVRWQQCTTDAGTSE
jgi:ketosteroid isomerase-like protein